MMHENPYERRAPRAREIQDELERIHHMILDTKAEIAQVKEDAIQEPGRAHELINLEKILAELDVREQRARHELENLNDESTDTG